ncbi:MAG: copper oxidase [Blastocatellia bacterium]
MTLPVRFRFFSVLSLTLFLAAISTPTLVQSHDNLVKFHLTDEPASWFKNAAGPVAGNSSLAVATPGVEVRFSGKSHTVHTMTSLIWPTGGAGMPFDTEATKGNESVVLQTPGLYVFVCKIHPYMLGAVVVDDPATEGLDLGENISLVHGVTVPTSSDLATRLLRTFFVITNPSNWQDFSSSAPWHINYPDVNVRITGGAVVNLPAVLNARYGNDTTLPPLFNPTTQGVGEVWVNTQYELTRRKEKPGTATAVNASNWKITRKVALPQINMNNPHNMWTDKDQELIYTAQWFDTRLTVFERKTGRLVRDIEVGEAPAHVMTRVDTDQVHVTINGSKRDRSVVELSPHAEHIERRIDINRPHPHAHWMSHDGKTMVTPNMFTNDSSIFDFPLNEANIAPVGALPIATGMMPDASKYYVANYLDSSITVINTQTGAVIKTINLLANYNPITGEVSGPIGGFPIQTPVSPNGKYMVTGNTLTATITIVDTTTDTLVKSLPGEAGCHGVQFGAKKGGGYYAYVSNKFSNTLIVVDGDPNNDGNPADATIVGRILLTASPGTNSDDRVTGLPGMGGQGVLPIPVVYNGWVQQLPQFWKRQLTASQRNPFP